MPIKDSLIAATALAHHLTVATRITTDYRNAGVPLVSPFEEGISQGRGRGNRVLFSSLVAFFKYCFWQCWLYGEGCK